MPRTWPRRSRTSRRSTATTEATVFAGDNIGASPLANGLFYEEPITIATNLMHVDFASVGNHEFDKGKAELLRIQNGGCRPTGCTGAPYALPDGQRRRTSIPGADFQYLSANVIVNATGQTLFPRLRRPSGSSATAGKKFDVGFIGEVLKSHADDRHADRRRRADLPGRGRRGQHGRASSDRSKGVDTWVLVIHQGGCADRHGDASTAAPATWPAARSSTSSSRLDPSIKVIVSAHTHNEYRCTITADGVTRLITSAASFGRILSDITLTIDDKTGELVQASADELDRRQRAQPAALERDRPHARSVQGGSAGRRRSCEQYVTASAPLANKVIGKASRATSPGPGRPTSARRPSAT